MAIRRFFTVIIEPYARSGERKTVADEQAWYFRLPLLGRGL
jgi:hypothetical protein